MRLSIMMYLFSIVLIASLCKAQLYSKYKPIQSKWGSTNHLSIEACGPCDREKCPSATDCNVGQVEDRCGCCKVCGLEESHLCNMEDDIPLLAYGKSHVPWHGRCGENLECRVRTDVDTELVGVQSICYCRLPGLACGSDGKSYSPCQMVAKSIATSGMVYKISNGPCKTRPTIELTAPSAPVTNGDKVTLICEAYGYPRADITWDLNKPGDGGKSRRMPSNSEDVAVSLRGGTSETQVTSYLQITTFSLEHEGEYRCLAENELGMDARVARVVLKA